MKNLSHDLARQQEAFRTLIEKRLPEHTAMRMEEHFHQSFAGESNAFASGGKWQKRKPTKNRKIERGQGTLIQTGTLKNSAETQIQGTQVTLSAGYEVGSWNLAQIHNEGLKPVPERSFMPKPGEESPVLTKEIQKFLDEEMDKIFK